MNALRKWIANNNRQLHRCAFEKLMKMFQISSKTTKNGTIDCYCWTRDDNKIPSFFPFIFLDFSIGKYLVISHRTKTWMSKGKNFYRENVKVSVEAWRVSCAEYHRSAISWKTSSVCHFLAVSHWFDAFLYLLRIIAAFLPFWILYPETETNNRRVRH